jgi:hypothetical protein
LSTRNLATSVIQLPTRNHGLDITSIEDINDKRKLTIFNQFLHSNDKQLKESTIANLRLELERRRTILKKEYNVLWGPTVKEKGLTHKYILWYNVEKILKKYSLKVALAKAVTVKKYLHLTSTKNDRKEYLYTQEFFFMPLH